MIVMLQTQGLTTLADVRGFPADSQGVEISTPQREAAYNFSAQTLGGFGYARLCKADKGLVRAYLDKETGLSRAQIARLIARHQGGERLHDCRGAPARPYRGRER
jgi:hypothetical protein